MRPTWMTWLGLGLVAPALALGCRQSRQYSTAAPGGGAYTPPMIGAMAPGSRAVDHETASPPPVVMQMPPAAAPAVVPQPRPIVQPARLEPVAAQRVTRPAELPQVSPAARVDLTRPGYQHAPDYSTLVGELHYNPRQDTWRLR